MTPRYLPTIFMLLCISSCTSVPYHIIGNTQESATLSACESLLQSVDRIIMTYKLKDRQFYSIPGFPYLRTNRFWSSFDLRKLNKEQLYTLIGQLNALDLQSRQIELSNLLSKKHQLANLEIEIDDSIYEAVSQCSRKMSHQLPTSDEVLSLLAKKMDIPDDYVSWKQVLGLYPLSKYIIRSGVSRLNRKIIADFKRDLTALPVNGNLTRYQPIEDLTNYIPKPFKLNTLGVPNLLDQNLHKLFIHHAPILEIDQLDEFDEIGELQFNHSKITVNTRQSVSYNYISYTRFEGKILPQLNYVFWFPRRRSEYIGDIYAGKIDGITWRVTLSQEGKVLTYDSIHNCGCYYMAFPTEALRPNPNSRDTSLLIPQFAPTLHANETRITLRLSTGKHYLQRVYASASEELSKIYHFVDYNKLRSANNGTHKQSLFDINGIMPGTNRLEQFLLWPAGIRSAGAMRQRGRHPISFVDRMHFDDPQLFNKQFIYKP